MGPAHFRTRLNWIAWIGLFLVLCCSGICNGDQWQHIRENARKIQTVQADFVQEKHMKILVKPLKSRGSFTFRMPDALRWEYTAPVRSVLLMYNGKTIRYIQGKDGMVPDDGSRLQSMQMVLGEITRWLNGHFDDNPEFSATLEGEKKIILSPREKTLSQIIARIEIELSETPGIFNSVTIHEGDDSFTRLTFQHPVLNSGIDERLFQGSE
jgi:outer membrane lipoprotein-sorting protein